jgi:hypothetical protein
MCAPGPLAQRRPVEPEWGLVEANRPAEQARIRSLSADLLSRRRTSSARQSASAPPRSRPPSRSPHRGGGGEWPGPAQHGARRSTSTAARFRMHQRMHALGVSLGRRFGLTTGRPGPQCRGAADRAPTPPRLGLAGGAARAQQVPSPAVASMARIRCAARSCTDDSDSQAAPRPSTPP